MSYDCQTISSCALLLDFTAQMLPNNINQMPTGNFTGEFLNKLLTKKTLNYIWWIKI